MTTAFFKSVDVALQDITHRISVRLLDETGQPVNADQVRIAVMNRGGGVIYQDDMNDPPSPPGVTRIVHDDTTTPGLYTFLLGDPTLFPLEPDGPDNQETAISRELVVQWHFEIAGEEDINETQTVKVIAAGTASLMNTFRRIIDKAAMVVDDDPENPIYVGYSKGDLVTYLEQGLYLINAFQPYPCWTRVEEFPVVHQMLLIDAALLVGLTSQELFAVATDVNYSDQGNVFTIEHQPKLSAVANAVWDRLKTLVPLMKRQYIMNGSIHIQQGPNFRLATLIATAPTGSTFRNAFTNI
jgi:hypothetical protein